MNSPLPEKDILTLHDRIFRVALAIVAVGKQCLQKWLPEQFSASVNWDSLKLEKLAGVGGDLRERVEDVLYSVQVGGRKVLVYVLLEHVTQPDKWVVWGLQERVMLVLRQWMAGTERPGRLPVVIPVVVYAGNTKWSVPDRLSELYEGFEELPHTLRALLLDGGYELVELGQRTEEELAAGNAARAVMLALREQRKGALNREGLLQILRWFLREEDEAVVEALAGPLWVYLTKHAELQEQEVSVIVEQVKRLPAASRSVQEKVLEKTMTLYELIENQGVRKGRVEGRAEGLTQGEWIGKIQLLESLMGEPPSSREELESLAIEELQARFAALEDRYNSKFKR